MPNQEGISREATGGPSGNPPGFRILVGHDGSEHSLAATRLLCDLPLGPATVVKLVEVAPSQQIASQPSPYVSLDVARGFFNGKGVAVLVETREGSPADVLLQEAKQFIPHLLVLGAVGMQSVLHRMLGSVAQRVVEEATCPVLIVRSPYRKLRRVLLALDDSPNSRQALECLAGSEPGQPALCPQFPLPDGAEVAVVHVLPSMLEQEAILHSWAVTPEFMPMMTSDSVTNEKAREQQEAAGRALVGEAKKKLLAAGLPASTHLFSGDVPRQILNCARDQEADLIVIGSRGLKTIQSWLLGSVSRKVIHEAECSVLVVKGEDHDPHP